MIDGSSKVYEDQVGVDILTLEEDAINEGGWEGNAILRKNHFWYNVKSVHLLFWFDISMYLFCCMREGVTKQKDRE